MVTAIMRNRQVTDLEINSTWLSRVAPQSLGESIMEALRQAYTQMDEPISPQASDSGRQTLREESGYVKNLIASFRK